MAPISDFNVYVIVLVVTVAPVDVSSRVPERARHQVRVDCDVAGSAPDDRRVPRSLAGGLRPRVDPLPDRKAAVHQGVIDLRVCTPEQFETQALRPDFPPLASAADTAEILGVSRQRVHQLAASNTRFPAPVARVCTGPLWTVPAIEHFARIWERRPGRPATRLG
jgi:hypothetical protein